MADRIASDLHEEFYFLGSFLFNLSIVLNTPSVITRLVRALSGGQCTYCTRFSQTVYSTFSQYLALKPV